MSLFENYFNDLTEIFGIIICLQLFSIFLITVSVNILGWDFKVLSNFFTLVTGKKER